MKYLALQAIQERSDWPWVEFRRVASIRRQANYSSDRLLLALSATTGIRQRPDKGGRQPASDQTISKYWVVRPNWLVFNPMWAIEGGVAVSQSEGAVSTAYRVYELHSTLHSRFAHYYLRSNPALEQYRLMIRGVTTFDRSITRSDFEAMPVPTPPISEQQAIARYLDAETARIDALISKKRHLIKLLEEQDRRIIDDLFGSVLSNRLTRLGYVADVRSGVTLGGTRPRAMSEVTVPYLRVANVQHDRLDLREVKTVTVDWATAQRTMLHSGDVLMTEGGDIDKLGRGTVWRGEIDPCLHQNHVFAVRVRTRDLLPDFLALVTRTSYARRYFEMTGVRSTNLASTNASKVSDFRIPYPSLDVQLALVRKYQRKWDALDRVRTALSRQLDLLTERRQALITAVVTGEMSVLGRGVTAASRSSFAQHTQIELVE